MNTPCPKDCANYREKEMDVWGKVCSCKRRLAFWKDDGQMYPKVEGCHKPKKEGNELSDYSMREINEALNGLLPSPDSPDWKYVQILTSALNELELLRTLAEASGWKKTVQP